MRAWQVTSMARVDYNAIADGIRAQLQSDAALNADAPVTVLVETPLMFSAESAPAIHIFFEGRDAPADQQRLAAGRRTDFILHYDIWCYEWHIDSVEEASRKRNRLIAYAETAIMSDLTLGGAVSYSWIASGEMEFAEHNGFLALGKIKLTAKVATTL
jgi:hypothetical protein